MPELTIEVLISCMYQKDYSLIKRTNISGDVLVINQSEEEKYEEYFDENKNLIRIKSTRERGLSKSRNLGLKMSKGDICLICDDDEILSNDYKEKIRAAFENSKADVICFALKGLNKKYYNKTKKIGYISTLTINSPEIAFRRDKIIKNDIWFNENIGSGVNNHTGGEEGKFLYDCLRKKLKIIFVPVTIGSLKGSESQWFKGFTAEYFFGRGISTTILMGKFFALLYACYFLIAKYRLYKKDISFKKASYSIFVSIYKYKS